MRLEDITTDQRLCGVVPGEQVLVVGVRRNGRDAVTLTFERTDGSLDRRLLYRADEAVLSVAEATRRPFDADAQDFRLVAEAQRIRLAGAFDPMLAVATSDVQPLPHQIRAVYGEMLPRTPLRYLLADDPGAGKTIMAGLYIKELLLRDVVRRVLIVAPGGLVEQWQDELWFKFGLEFDLLTSTAAEAALGRSVFDGKDRLIARMDQLARNDDLNAQLADSEWDLVVVDEAHRMSAHYFGGKLERSKRFQLGELLGERTRHLLLMTATPHAGKQEDFELFLTLLDRDKFEGKARRGVTPGDTSDVMRRMVKEDLLTFEGKPLFPERIAQTVPYELSPEEQDLYEQVTAYVRNEMGRAQNLDGKRRNTVGFALTVLQRRLASSPEAIFQSLRRRSDRLQRRRQDLINGVGVADPFYDERLESDPDEFAADEIETVEEELVDAATAARTVDELDAELAVLDHLVAAARKVRHLDTDRKWIELRDILEHDVIGQDDSGRPRKLIIFTEHRDTLDYLERKITGLLGRSGAVRAIHGGVRRVTRREITEEFTHNPDCHILLATDAAGEGLNLQVAHLMVNYDLPWNPNRIEQRFGRIHRIGQTEVCRLWNLVAQGTREGAVFTRLLEKVEEQRQAYGGRVFDVLGAAFDEHPLRDLLLEAIQYGERPEVRARMDRVIDASVAEGVRDLLEERALAKETMAEADLQALRRTMDEVRARRLQPHFIAECFLASLKALGGRAARREAGRYEISNVPAVVRERAKADRRPVATRYDRVTFDLDRVDGTELTRAELIAPGHVLHDAVLTEVLATRGEVLERGVTLVSSKVSEPELLVALQEEIVDGTGTTIGKRFGYAYVNADGRARPAGPAPYLDCVAAPVSFDVTSVAGALDGAEGAALDWLVTEQLPAYLAEVAQRRVAEVKRSRAQVTQRLNLEINRLSGEAMEAAERQRLGKRVRETPESLERKAAELDARLTARTALLDKQALLSSVPPRVVAAAVVLPPSAVELPADAPMHAVATEEVERRGVDAVLAAERILGRAPEEMARNNPGYDIRSFPGPEQPDGPTIFVEVKARIAGAKGFYVTHTEIRHGQNAAPHYRLALVRVDPRGPEHDEVRYLTDPFRELRLGAFDADGVLGNWARTWAKGSAPF
ncbi:helicase-related protein [Microlunatus parietis]|uniref:Superfamily II DNA or RNA helicase n=1 Tax=Microlunatus parietis TaxID=682979 RepID=A0A7Y9I648_9ACTN|nr:helicase-related protein [Microlunatus parietis]NYE70987.1 superfamily II DNA or RNA helicase [Microlunatus parietis]